MTPRINLLPASYLQARRRNRRCRRGALIVSLLLMSELAGGLYVHHQASETRSHLSAAEGARFAAQEMKAQLVEPKRTLQRLDQQVELAERLRVTHYWSRLLVMLGDQLPERVILTSVTTDPARWTQATVQEKRGQQTRIRKSTLKPDEDEPAPLKSLLKGLRISGYAADYRDLAALTAALNDSDAFNMVDLREAKRGQYLGRDVVQFEMHCRW